MITEIFVSLDNVNFNKLDLDDDETIPMRYTFKDTQDISKIFSPYSLDFTLKASPNNLLSFGHFGNTNVIKTTNLRKLKCKVYVNSILNQFGLLKLEKINEKNGKPDTITASFATTMTNLKDKIGDDTIDLLASAVVEWMPRDIYSSLTAIKTNLVNGIPLKYYIPLASTNRVWQYNETTPTALDNIVYSSASNPNSTKVIKGSELRPAISFSTIIELIKQKYGLLISSPIESRTEFKDAFIWCMGKNISNQNQAVQYVLKTNLGAVVENISGTPPPPTPRKYAITSSTANNSFKIVKSSNALGWSKIVLLKLSFDGVNFLGEGEKNITISLNRLGQTETFLTETFDLSEGNNNLDLQIKDSLLISDEVEFQINVTFGSPTIWTNSKVIFKYSFFKINGFANTTTASYTYTSNLNNNVLDMGGSKIDLIKSLPEIKVIDFLTSYFKAFNISVLDVTPDDDSLYWYTPQDIEANKKEVTYVADISDVEKSVQEDFNYYIFQHAESNFRSNVDYKIGAGLDYAKTQYPEIKPKEAKEFKVETNFTLIPPVTVVGTEDVTTYYGFEAGQPTILDTGEARYTPNFGELVLFYSHGNKPLNRQFGVQSSLLNGNLITASINSYILSLPYTVDFKSFAWSVLVINNLALRDNLFSIYYLKQIARSLDQNVMKQDFKLTLNAEQLRAFRLENDVIIGENRFSILDATPDIVSGKTTLKLLNY